MRVLLILDREVNEKLDRLYVEVNRAAWENDHHAVDFIEGQIIAWREIKNRLREITDISL